MKPDPYQSLIKADLQTPKPYKYNYLNIAVWLIALPLGALIWIAFMGWVFTLIF